jgi:hypothetical protein
VVPLAQPRLEAAVGFAEPIVGADVAGADCGAPGELPACDPSFAGHRVGDWDVHLDIGLRLPEGVVADERGP